MAYDPDVVKKQVIANMGLSVRDTAGVPTYDTNLGDSSYSGGQIDRAVLSAAVLIARTICETPGHPELKNFQTLTTLTHTTRIPEHIGPMGLPIITPYSGCAYTLTGKRKSVDQIADFRANVNNRYTNLAHDQTAGSNHSKLAGLFALDGHIFYFTGFSAQAWLAIVTEANAVQISETRHELATAIAIAMLRMDGDISDISDKYAAEGMQGLASIRAQGADQPSLTKTVGSTRDGGQK